MSVRRVVDVTDLTVWHGTLSGIQRVVYEMAARYVDESNVEFCYYVEQDEKFYRLSDVKSLLYPVSAIVGHTPPNSGSSIQVKVLRHTKRGLRAIMPPVVTRLSREGRSRFEARRRRDIADQQHPFQQTDTPFEFERDDILIVYGAHWDKPHYTAVISKIKETVGIKIVHNINDFIPVYDRAHTAEVEHTRFPRYMQSVCELSDALLFISQATRRDYERFLEDYNIKNRAKTGVMILGEDITEKEMLRPPDIVEEPYILNVGTIEVRKNPVLLYQVYRLAHERNIDLPHLYMVGRAGWLTGDIYYQIIHDDAVNSKMHIRHDIDDKGLSWMYENCEFFVFPSFYEGWGLPVAEAAHHHKLSAASNASSMPEVVGEYAEYFSPYSADECLAVIVSLMDASHRAGREQNLQSRVPHTWDQTYDDAEAVIKQII